MKLISTLMLAGVLTCANASEPPFVLSQDGIVAKQLNNNMIELRVKTHIDFARKLRADQRNEIRRHSYIIKGTMVFDTKPHTMDVSHAVNNYPTGWHSSVEELLFVVTEDQALHVKDLIVEVEQLEQH